MNKELNDTATTAPATEAPSEALQAIMLEFGIPEEYALNVLAHRTSGPKPSYVAPDKHDFDADAIWI